MPCGCVAVRQLDLLDRIVVAGLCLAVLARVPSAALTGGGCIPSFMAYTALHTLVQASGNVASHPTEPRSAFASSAGATDALAGADLRVFALGAGGRRTTLADPGNLLLERGLVRAGTGALRFVAHAVTVANFPVLPSRARRLGAVSPGIPVQASARTRAADTHVVAIVRASHGVACLPAPGRTTEAEAVEAKATATAALRAQLFGAVLARKRFIAIALADRNITSAVAAAIERAVKFVAQGAPPSSVAHARVIYFVALAVA